MKKKQTLITSQLSLAIHRAFFGPPKESEIPDSDSDDGPQVKSSVFADFVLDSIKEEEEASKQKKEEPKKEEEVKEEDKKEEEKKEEEPENKEEEFNPVDFDESALVTKKGRPVSANVTDVIKKFKEKAKQQKDLIEKLEKDAQANKPLNLEEHEEYKKLKEERDKLRETVDTEYFYESDSFKSKYVEPVTKAQAAVKKYTETLDEDDKEEIRPLLAKATEALKAGNEAAFDKALDEASELFTPSAARKFSSAMGDLWESHNEYAEALKDKEKAKSDISKKKDLTLNSQTAAVSNLLKEATERFFEVNKDVVAVFESNPKLKESFNYKESVTKSANAVSYAIKDFQATGEITQDLRVALVKATQFDAIQKEREVQGEIIREQMQTESALRAEIKKLSDKVLALSSTDNKGRYKNIDEKDKKEDKKSSGSILYDALVS
jgi:hypothetical protein